MNNYFRGAPNTYSPRVFEGNGPNHTSFANNNFHKQEYAPVHPHPNVSYRSGGYVNSNPNQVSVSAPPPVRFPARGNHYYPPQPIRHPIEQNSNMRALFNPFPGNSGIMVNRYPSDFPSPMQNITYSTGLPGPFPGYPNNASHISKNDFPKTFNTFPQNALSTGGNTNNIMENSTVSSSESGNNSMMLPVNSPAVPSSVLTSRSLLSLEVQNNCTFSVPSPMFNSDTSYTPVSDDPLKTSSKKQKELCTFLSKFSASKVNKGSQITIPEFRSVLKAAFSLMKLLLESKYKLTNLMEADESEWNLELQNVSNIKIQLSEIFSLISAPIHLNAIAKKLNTIKRKRELKKKTKVNKLSQRIKMEQKREERNQEIDKYLDDIKEKNLKLKWEAEMKKEADYILWEVRKKIQEGKRTIEKIKVFEKLRNTRKANAVQKGLHILPSHNEKFEKKIACLKETMQKQLVDYEAEEKALKVMLEIEQEGQLEEEIRWKLKTAEKLQQIKKNHITESLFGKSEDPDPTDPLFLFHKYHTSSNSSIENLVQIRHHWDVHLAEDGEAVPQQWVVPVTPSNSSWEQWLKTSVPKK